MSIILQLKIVCLLENNLEGLSLFLYKKVSNVTGTELFSSVNIILLFAYVIFSAFYGFCSKVEYSLLGFSLD